MTQRLCLSIQRLISLRNIFFPLLITVGRPRTFFIPTFVVSPIRFVPPVVPPSPWAAIVPPRPRRGVVAPPVRIALLLPRCLALLRRRHRLLPLAAMAGRLLLPLLLLLLILPSPAPAGASPREAASKESRKCPRLEDGLPPFAGALRQTCRVSAEGYPAEEINGEQLLRVLGGKEEYTAVLFYASWCPFSQRMRPIFDDLSTMFPQIKHVAVEESNVMPAVLSRYGVRSLPSVIIAHGSYAFWPLGSKDLGSLINFYTAVTGQEPVAYIGPRTWSTARSTHYAKLWNGSIRETVKSEPYLSFSIMFICVRIFLFFFQKFFAVVKGFWMQYFRHINLGVIAKLTQLLECMPHVVDVSKIWSKWRLMVGLKNAKVWASSLTSVSLGGQSSPRAAVLD